MIKLFKLECPSCGAALNLKMDKGASTMCACEYCESKYIISNVDIKKCTANITKTAGSNNDNTEIKGETVSIETDSKAYIKNGAFRIFIGIIAFICFNALYNTLPDLLAKAEVTESTPNSAEIIKVFELVAKVCSIGGMVATLMFMLLSAVYVVAGLLPKESRAVMIEHGFIGAITGNTYDDTNTDQ